MTEDSANNKNKKKPYEFDKKLDKLKNDGELSIRTNKVAETSEFNRSKLPARPDMTEEELDSKVYNSKLYHRKVNLNFLENLLEKMKYQALNGDTFCMRYFIQRSLRPENDVITHKFEGLVGLNSLEKISQAYELVCQAMGEGKLSYKESQDIVKTLAIYSQHLRDTEQLSQMKDSVTHLSQSVMQLCKAANLEEPEELKKVLKTINLTEYEYVDATNS